MANDVTEILRKQVSRALQEAVGGNQDKSDGGGLGSGKGMLAGAALAAAAPMAKRGIQAYRNGGLDDFLSKLGTGEALEDVRSRVNGGEPADDGKQPERDGDRQPQAEAGEDGGGEDGGDEREPEGGPNATGKGRRLPVQQAVDVGVPLETAYNQFTQFEDWPEFMHRVTRVTQEDDCTISFATKIWGKTKEFTADIVTQRPEHRIKWRVSQGITHTGVVTFHELAPRLTRIEVTLDVDPGSLIEKAARGMRHVKRAVRADLHRFKAFIEMQDAETGAWRGVIVDGEVVEPHDESYDEERDYSDIEDAKAEGDEDSGDEEQEEPAAEADDDAESDEEPDEEPVRRRRPQARARKRQPAPA